MSLKDIQKDQETILRVLLSEQSVLGIAILQDGVLKFMNHAFRDILGVSVDEAMKWKSNEFAKVIHPDDLSFVLDQAQRKQTGDHDAITQYSFRFITKTGDIKWIEVFSKTIEYQGRLADFVTYIDITDRMQSESALKISKTQLQAQYKGLPISTITWQYNKGDFVLVNYNDSAMTFTEQKIADLLGKKASEVYQDLPDILNDLSRCYEEKISIKREGLYRMITTGKQKYLAISYAYVPPDLVLIHSEDISDRKQTQFALHASEERYRTLFENARDAIGITSPDGKYLDFNPATLQLFGYTSEELRKLDVQELYVDPNDRIPFQQQLESKGEVIDYEIKLRKKDGTIMVCLNTATVLRDENGKIWAYHNITRDITARKKAEEALQLERDRIQKYLDIVGVILVALDKEHRVTLINRKGCDVLGYKEAEILRKDWIKTFLPAETQKEVKHVFDQLMTGDLEPVEYFENAVVNRNGEERIIAWYNTLLIDDQGNRIGTLSSGEDITERKTVENALIASEERYRLLFNMSSDAVTLHGVTSEGLPDKYIEVNDVMCQRLGYSREELLKRSPLDINDPDSVGEISKYIEQLFDIEHLVFERVHVSKTGQKIPVEISSHLFELNGQLTILAIIRDISERKKAENALRTSEERFRTLFEDAPIAIDESDYSGVKRYLDLLREQGVVDFRKYFEQYPNVVTHCASLVRLVSMNKKSLELYQAENRADLEKRFTEIPSEETYNVFKEELLTFLNGNSIFEAEYSTTTIKGNTRHVFVKWTIVPGYESTWEKILTSIVDISELVQAEADVHESEEKYRILFETAPDAIGITTPEGRFIDMNPATLDLYGYSREEMWQLHVEEVYADPTDRIKFQQELEEKGSVKDYEMNMKKKDGTIMHCFTTSTVRRTPSGKILGYQNITRDISARKHTEAALQMEKDRFQQYLNVAGVFILAIDQERKITLINKKGSEILGYPEEEIIGKSFELFMPEHIRNITRTRFEKMIGATEDFSTFFAEYPILTKNGEERLLAWNNSPIKSDQGEIIGLLSSGEDITEQKRAEITLKESEARYRILFEDAPISLWEEDFSAVKHYLDQLRQQGVTNFRTFFEQNPEAVVHCVTLVNVVDVNKATLKLYEAKYKEDLFGDLISQAYTKESFNDYKAGIIAFTEGQMVFETESIRKTLNGNEIHLVVRWSCPPGYEDTWDKVFVSLLNITDRKKAEDALHISENALRSSEERFRRLAEASFEGIVIFEQFKIVDANLNFARMFGYRLDEIIGMNILDLIAPESQESAQFHIRSQSEKAYEGIGIRKNGTFFPYEAHGRPTLFQRRPARVSALRDITAQRQIEEARKELEEQQAEFVSVTSHELRTPLTAIRGYTELLEQRTNEITQDQQIQCFQAVRRNIKRLEDLISSVSTLGQLERGLFNLNLKKMDIYAFLIEALQPYQSFLNDQIEVPYKPERDIFINGDSDRLLQVLNNLLENAVKHTSKSDRHICVELKILPQNVQIKIVDNGAGIDPDNLDRIFEPFVSIPTHYSAIGSGIGLYLARKITDAHGGSLIAHSEGNGRGSTFTLKLPRIHES